MKECKHEWSLLRDWEPDYIAGTIDGEPIKKESEPAKVYCKHYPPPQ